MDEISSSMSRRSNDDGDDEKKENSMSSSSNHGGGSVTLKSITYWCHMCSKEVDVKFIKDNDDELDDEDEDQVLELECVYCKGNFVEECTSSQQRQQQQQNSSHSSSSSRTTTTNDDVDDAVDPREGSSSSDHPSMFVVPSSPPFRSGQHHPIRSNMPPPFALGQQQQQQQQGGGSGQGIQNVLNQVLSSIGLLNNGVRTTTQTTTFGGGSITVGDYAFGNMDDVLNQLLQVHVKQKPRTSKTFIENLKHIEISEDDLHECVSEGCAVCKDQFEKKQIAHKLPCGHTYHRDCILPWIKTHNTCPVCRHELPSEAPSASNGDTSSSSSAPSSSSSSSSSETTTSTRSSPAPPSASRNNGINLQDFNSHYPPLPVSSDNMLASDNDEDEEDSISMIGLERTALDGDPLDEVDDVFSDPESDFDEEDSVE